ncbi:aldehyde dehydrogenase family protein [Microbacterium trichothecenolyticum]|uniref:Aldehyde dehydrogenase family protein n=1 Tax=Microbacterium ureisolvens TaxID=2781186 RepID=A0ABS7HYF5_9MICO|nr:MULTISPECIES: aldehyde dehydrogenase family protein [Microbacterium]MBW9110407.1 aldehyde dehydrogenase family protein [Microbacterium ureisolvens]MBW9120512.1 aldehyde dehydrogenase family protein [Microbacterium trichothecenolyticum]
MNAPAYRVVNPATGDLVEEFTSIADDDLAAAIESAHAAYVRDRDVPVADRLLPLRRAASLLRERTTELAAIAAAEIGKPLEQGRGEVEFCADIFDYYAQHAERLTAPQPISSGSGRARIERRPLGVLLGIMPWNYPFYQAARFVAPNLAVGNTILLKPAESCPRSALALDHLLREAGVGEGAFHTAFATHEQIRTVIQDARVQGVSLTGSERAGAAVAAAAGAHLKKVVLELGGSDPHVILDTAHVAEAAAAAWSMRMENLGQACNSNKRIIVAAAHYAEFVSELTKLASALEPGDPLDLRDGQFPPMASRAAAEHLCAQIEDAISRGATLHTGGTLHTGPGAYFSPAVLTGVTPGMRAYHEELFGPVAVVYRAEDDEHALRIANDTEFGLGAAVFSTDIARAEAFAARVETGMVAINALAAEGAELPFGGVKRSGYGRELGPLGMDEFVNKRLIYTA